MITCSDGLILDVNAAFEMITGYARDEVLGGQSESAQFRTQDTAFYAEMWRSLDLHDYWQGEVCNRRKGGEFYVEWLTITTIRDASGNPRARSASSPTSRPGRSMPSISTRSPPTIP